MGLSVIRAYASAGLDPRDFASDPDLPRRDQNEPYPQRYQMRHHIRLSLECCVNRVDGRSPNRINVKAERMNQSKTHPNRDFAIDYDLMNFINDTVKIAMEDGVQDAVDKELWLMVNGEGFEKRINGMIDARLQTLVEEMIIKTSGAGPGRGHKGRSHRKISLSLPETLYQRARELEGFFSCHVASALELYLKLHKG